jgi:hypothetical protein
MRWERNLQYIEKHNKEADSGKHTYWLAMNKYGDMVRAVFDYLRPRRTAEPSLSFVST